MRTIGVVLGAGVGVRLGSEIPKQLIKVAGKTILEHTVSVMNSSPDLDEVIVMITPGYSEKVAAILGGRYPKVWRILEGGNTRNDTTRIVMDAIGQDDCKVVLHDAVRPLVNHRIIHDCVASLDSYDAVDVVIHSADTIVQVGHDDVISTIPDRSTLRRGQTPQAFKLSTLRRAYEAAAKDPDFHATDDCGVVVKYLPEVKTKTVEGSEENIKITHPIDLQIADKLYQIAARKAPQVDDLKRGISGKVIVVFGASHGIGGEIATLGRSLGATIVAHSRSLSGVHVEKPDEVARALAEAATTYGRIDAVVVTAGVLRIRRLVDESEEDLRSLIDINLVAPALIAQLAYPYLKESRGHLQLFTSSSYTRGRENYALYSATKAAVVNLTQALSEEWADDGIAVNVVNPERTKTPMRTAAFGAEDPTTLLSPKRVAEASLRVLASTETGHVIDVRRTDPASDPESFAAVLDDADLADSEGPVLGD